MATAGSIVVDLLLRTGSFETDAQRASRAAEKNFKAMQKQAAESAAKISSAFTGIFTGALFGISAGAIFGKFIEETKKAQDEQAQLAAALTSTGRAAGYTIGQLNSMAAEFAGKSIFSEGDINRAQTRLLSYTGIVGEQFPKALQATIDTAQRMGMTVEQAAETVGRALDIPSQGLSSLSKQGFRFTEDQKKMVEQLERTGQVAKAQQFVLDALESSYGGAAFAARNTLGGALQTLQNRIDDLMTGDDGSVNGLTSAINEFADLLGSPETKQAFASFLSGIVDIVTEVTRMVSAFSAVIDKTGGFVEALGAFSPANGIGSLFRDDAENIKAAQDELADLAAMQERLNNGAAKWNDYNQKSLDIARKAAQARLDYYQGRQTQKEKDVFSQYLNVGETGAGDFVLPTIPVIGSSGDKKKKKEVDEGQKLLDQLQKQVALTGELTERQKLQIQIEQGYVTFKTQSQQQAALAAADTLDFINEQNKTFEEQKKQAEDLQKILNDLYPDRAELDQFVKQLDTLTAAMSNGALTVDEYYDAVDRLGDKFDGTMTQATKFAEEAARNIQDALGDGLYDILSGNFDNIGEKFSQVITRMVANAASANLAAALFGDFGSTGKLGGLLGDAFSGFFGGGGGAGQATAADVASAGDGLMFFAEGGFTGPGSKSQVAGVVHAGEYVLNSEATRRLGVGYLDKLNGYATGGYVGSAPPASGGATMRVEVVNSGAPKEVKGVERGFDASGDVVRIIVSDMQRNGPTAKAVRGLVGA